MPKSQIKNLFKSLPARVEWIINNFHGKKMLDIGFATKAYGVCLNELIRQKNPNSQVVSLDIVKEKVLEYKFNDLVVGDVLNLPFKNSVFDAVGCFEVLEHVWEPKRLLEEIHRVLKTKGRLYLSTPNAYDWLKVSRFWFKGKGTLGSPDHTILYDPISLSNLLKKTGFDVVSLETKDFRLKTEDFRVANSIRTIKKDIFKRAGFYIVIIAEKI